MLTLRAYMWLAGTHHDIDKETPNAQFVKRARKFFDAAAVRAANNGHVVDVLACHFEQVLP